MKYCTLFFSISNESKRVICTIVTAFLNVVYSSLNKHVNNHSSKSSSTLLLFSFLCRYTRAFMHHARVRIKKLFSKPHDSNSAWRYIRQLSTTTRNFWKSLFQHVLEENLKERYNFYRKTVSADK